MEVLVGPTAFAIESAYGRDAATAQENNRAAVASRLFSAGASGEGIGSASRIDAEDDVSSETSSSIGTPSDDDDDGGDGVDENDSSFNSSDEAESKFRGGVGGRSLASLNSLEDSLPIKRGLSNHFAGKSKSFASLADVCTVRDLKKTENPFNKRRRLLIASKLAKKSFYSFANPKSMPLLALKEDDDDNDDFDDHDLKPERLHIHDEQDDDDDDDDGNDHDHNDGRGLRYAKFHDKRFKSFKTRCFSLANLQEHSVLEDD